MPIILAFVKKLAAYEKLSHEVVASEELLRETLFGARRTAEVAIGTSRQAGGFVPSLHNYRPSWTPRDHIEDLLSRKVVAARVWPRAATLRRAPRERAALRAARRSVLDGTSRLSALQELGAVPMSEWTVFA